MSIALVPNTARVQRDPVAEMTAALMIGPCMGLILAGAWFNGIATLWGARSRGAQATIAVHRSLDGRSVIDARFGKN